MNRNKLIVSIEEARKLLGKPAENMDDSEIIEVITTLDLMTADALEKAKHRLQMKSDANKLAGLIYDIYQNKKQSEKGS